MSGRLTEEDLAAILGGDEVPEPVELIDVPAILHTAGFDAGDGKAALAKSAEAAN